MSEYIIAVFKQDILPVVVNHAPQGRAMRGCRFYKTLHVFLLPAIS